MGQWQSLAKLVQKNGKVRSKVWQCEPEFSIVTSSLEKWEPKSGKFKAKVWPCQNQNLVKSEQNAGKSVQQHLCQIPVLYVTKTLQSRWQLARKWMEKIKSILLKSEALINTALQDAKVCQWDYGLPILIFKSTIVNTQNCNDGLLELFLESFIFLLHNSDILVLYSWIYGHQ